MQGAESDHQKSPDFMVGVNRFRESLYVMLSRAFSKEADKPFMDDTLKVLHAIEGLPDLMEIPEQEDIQKGKHLIKGFFDEMNQGDPEEVLVDLSREYAASFLGVGQETVALCESVYQGKTGSLFQESYFEVKERYTGTGMEKSEDYAEPEDHLSIELAYMAALCRLIMESGENGGLQLQYLKTQLEFVERHLLPWVPAFLKRLQAVNISAFYEAWGYFLNGYVKVDLTLIESLIEEVETKNSALRSADGKGVGKRGQVTE